tara:strand:+ start:927 stop:1325 length:399 start_codon:yes stop_codon:yes gene_type:complete
MNDIKVMCVNKTHEYIIVHFLEQIQLYIDDITDKDEDFDVFSNVLRELVAKSNNNVIFSFLGGHFTEDWINQLPMTVYYAVVGYMHLIRVDLHDLIDTTEKLNSLIGETMMDLEFVSVDAAEGDTYYKVCLN